MTTCAPGLRQPPRDGEPQAGPAAGDQRVAPGQVERRRCGGAAMRAQRMPITSCMSNRPAVPCARLAATKRAARSAPLGKVHARAGPVRELEALAGARENHAVVADHVAAAQGGKADRVRAGARRSPLRGRTRRRSSDRGRAPAPPRRRAAAPSPTAHRPCADDASRRSPRRSLRPEAALPAPPGAAGR